MKTTLQHNQLVRLASWVSSTASVGTAKGYAAEYNETTDSTEAWTNFLGTALCADPGFYDRKRAEHASATIIADGQEVEIEGRTYQVRVMPGNDGRFPRNSDPIHFVEVK